MLRKAGIISQNVGGLVGNSISTDVSMVDNSIRLYLTSASEEKYITELYLEGVYFTTSTETCSLSINFFTTYNYAISTRLLNFVSRTNTLFVHKFLACFPSLRREVRPVRYHAACAPVYVCQSASVAHISKFVPVVGLQEYLICIV